MTRHDPEMTIDELLADPIILAVRKADKVDPRSFETMLHGLANGFGEGRATPDAIEADKNSECGWMPAAHLCRAMLDGMVKQGIRSIKPAGAAR